MRIVSRLVTSLLLFSAAVAVAAETEVVDRIVLRVNGEIATLSDYAKQRDERVEAIAQAGNLSLEQRRALVADAGKTTMREIFEEMLALSRARQMRITIPQASLERAVESQRERFGLQSQEEFESALRQSGMTMQAFRRRVERQMLINEALERDVRNKIHVYDEDVSRYWREHQDEFLRPEQRKVEELVVREDSDLTPAERERLASSLAERAQAGEELGSLVAGTSEGTVAGPIDHGWVEKGTLVGELDAAVWSLGAGQSSDPVSARGGLHVLRVVEIRPAETRPLEEVADEVRNQIGQDRFATRAREWLDELARNAYVVEKVPEDAIGYRTTASPEIDPLRKLLSGPEPVAPASAESPEPAAEPAGEAEP